MSGAGRAKESAVERAVWVESFELRLAFRLRVNPCIHILLDVILFYESHPIATSSEVRARKAKRGSAT